MLSFLPLFFPIRNALKSNTLNLLEFPLDTFLPAELKHTPKVVPLVKESQKSTTPPFL